MGEDYQEWLQGAGELVGELTSAVTTLPAAVVTFTKNGMLAPVRPDRLIGNELQGRIEFRLRYCESTDSQWTSRSYHEIVRPAVICATYRGGRRPND